MRIADFLLEQSLLENLTPQEQQMIKGYSPAFIASIVRASKFVRGKNKNASLVDVAKQLNQAQPSEETQKFLRTNDTANTLVAPMANIPKPANQVQGITPPPAHVTAAPQSPVAAPQAVSKPQVAPPPSWVGNTQNVGFYPQQTAAKDADNFQKRMSGEMPSLDDQFQKQQNTRKNKMPSKNNPWAAPPVKESINEAMPAMLGGTLKNVFAAIQRLKPEEIAVLIKLIGGMASPAGGATSMTTTKMENKNIARIVSKRILEQKQVALTAHVLMTESPLGNIWDRIKQAGTSAVDKMSGKGVKGGTIDAGASDHQRQLVQELGKQLSKVAQFRQKFNSAILKNSESLNAYHDLILNLYSAYEQHKAALGPFAVQLGRQIEDAVGNLYNDLSSEKSQIVTFLKSLENVNPEELDAKRLGNQAKGKDRARWDEEADATQRASSSSTKGVKGSQGNNRMATNVKKNAKAAEKEAISQIKQKWSDKLSDKDKRDMMNQMTKLFSQTIKNEKMAGSPKK